jgi:hypothetical protein
MLNIILCDIEIDMIVVKCLTRSNCTENFSALEQSRCLEVAQE